MDRPDSSGGSAVKAMVLGALLPIVAAGGAWLLVNEAPAPAAPDSPSARVPPFVAVDSSSNGNDGIIQGDALEGLPGKDGTSYSFVQPGSWIQVPSAPEINPGIRDFAVSVWVQLAEFPGPGETYDVVRKGVAYTAPGEFKLEVLSSGRVRCTAKDSAHRVATVTSFAPIPEDGAWHRIGCARTGDAWSVVIDDAIRSQVVDLGAVANTVSLSIGGKYGLEDRIPSRVDDVKLFIGGPSAPTSDAAPPAPEAIRSLERGSPAGWWRLDEAATSAAGR
jgi:hypothetical protein